MLAMLVLWLASWVLDRHARAAQVLSSLHLRLLGAAFLHSAGLSRASLSRAAAVAVAEQPRSEPAAAAEPASPRPSASAARRLALVPSPAGKDISSFRLPDHAIAGGRARRRASAAAAAGRQQPGVRAGQKQLRWSLDGAGGQPRRQQVGTQPKPRTSVDFDPSPASPAGQPHHGAGVADHRASPCLEDGASTNSSSAEQLAQSPAQEQGRWQPSMRRITSGQELAELAAVGGAGCARSSLDAGNACPGASEGDAALDLAGQPEVPAQAAAEPSASATSECTAGLAADHDAESSVVSVATAAAALSSWLPALSLPLTWPASPGAAQAAPDAAAVDPADPGASPFSPTSAAAAAAAAAVARRVAESGTAAAAWASSTVDSVLRPLMPASSSTGSALLWRSYSSANPNSSAVDVSGSHGAASAQPPAAAATATPLEHAASAPLPRAAAAAASALDGLTGQAFASACLAARAAAEGPGRRSVDVEQRRISLDGVSARHYSSGAVTADPSRWDWRWRRGPAESPVLVCQGKWLSKQRAQELLCTAAFVLSR